MWNVTAKLGTAGVLATSLAAQVPPRAFTPVELIPPDAALDVATTRAVALNNRGQVIVEGADEDSQIVRSWLWENGTLRDLGEWDVNGLNESGQIVGRLLSGRGPHAALWQEGTLTDLHPAGPPGYTSAAVAITDDGQIAGHATSSEGTHYCPCDQVLRWEDGASRALGVLPGDATARATGISPSGEIVGFSTGYHPVPRVRAFLQSGDAWTELRGLIPNGASHALGVNDRGEVVGWSEDRSRAPRAVLWHEGNIVDLGVTGHATAINRAGTVVGWLERLDRNGVPFRRGFVRDGPTIIELPPLPGMRHSYAAAINDRGDIVGYSADDAMGARARATLWPSRDKSDGRAPDAAAHR